MTGDEDGMVRLGWSIPQVGHFCGAVVVGVVVLVVGQSCFRLPTIRNPTSAVIILPSKQNPLAPPFRRSVEASYHPTRPTESIRSHSFLGWPVLNLLAGGDQASLPRCLLHGSQRHWFNRGVPVRCGAATRVARRSHSPRVAASSNGQPLFKGCMNTLIGGIAKST